jgi:hypothetical protein
MNQHGPALVAVPTVACGVAMATSTGALIFFAGRLPGASTDPTASLLADVTFLDAGRIVVGSCGTRPH